MIRVLRLAEKVTTFAASRLISPEEKERYQEEWLAELPYCQGGAKKLAVAFGHLAAARRLRGRILQREFRGMWQQTEPLLADVVVDAGIVEKLHTALTEPRFGSAWPPTAAIISNAGVGAAAFAASVAKGLGPGFRPPVVVEFGHRGSPRDPVAAVLAAFRVRRMPITSSGRKRLCLRLTARQKLPIVAVNLQDARALHRLLFAVSAQSPVLITARSKPQVFVSNKVLVYNVVSIAPRGEVPDREAVVLLAPLHGRRRQLQGYPQLRRGSRHLP
jgi:hypothetical protein